MSEQMRDRMPGIAHAAEWRLLGLLFERPHDAWRGEVAALAHEVGDSEIRMVAAAAQDATEGMYMAVLGPGGVVSPREVTYCSFEDPGRILADLAGFYEAFGFHPHAEDPPDHVAVEAGFVGYLLLKEEYARLHDDQAAVEISANARRRFLETHLSPLAGAFAERLSAGGSDYLAQAALLLAARVPTTTASAPAFDQTEAFSGCGGCTFADESPEDER